MERAYITQICPDAIGKELDGLIQKVEDNRATNPCNTLPMKDKCFTLMGNLQAGKTRWMLCRVILDIMSGRSAVVILREINGDYVQFIERFMDMKALFKTRGYFECEAAPNVHTLSKGAEAGAIISARTPKLIISISNASPLRKLSTLVERTASPYYSLYIDEDDHVDSGKGLKLEYINILKERASMVGCVSATIFETVLGKEIQGTLLLRLTPSEIYKGVKDFKRVVCDEIGYSCDSNASLFGIDPGLRGHLDALRMAKPYRWGEGLHPHIHLINIGVCKRPQRMAQEETRVRIPQLATVVYNGDGVSFYHPLYTDTNITNMTRCADGIHRGPVTISAVLEFCEEQGVEKTPAIAIFSGRLAGRGISYTSGKMRGGRGWHITALRFGASTMCSQANLLQAVGRLCGNFADDIPLTLYATQQIHVDVLRAYLLQEEAMRRSKLHKGLLINCALRKLSFHADKVGYRMLSKTKGVSNLNLGEDEWDWKGFFS
jgi:hypothetical protein